MIELIFALVWIAGIAAAFSRRWIRRQADAWPIVILWPLALALVVGILFYEGCYGLFQCARRRRRRA